MLFNFILCEMFGGFDVNKVLSHLVQLSSFHKKLKEELKKNKIYISLCSQKQHKTILIFKKSIHI